MSLLLALLGGGPPPDGGIPWQPADWLVLEEDDDDDGSWISAVYAAAFVAPEEVIGFAVAEDDDLEDEGEHQLGQVTPPLNDLIQSVAEQPEDDEEAEPDWLPSIYADAPAAAVDFVQSWLSDDEDSEDGDALDAIAQIVDGVAAASDFIQSVFEAGLDDDDADADDGLFDATWNAAFDPAPPVVPPPPADAAPLFGGGTRPPQGYRSERDEALLVADDLDAEDLVVILAAFLRKIQ